MVNRPPIPREVARAILIEAGHRCAVCGVPCPLERAHIVPWSRRNSHEEANLICLCANCHARADIEKWGERTLREYKLKPWVLRQYKYRENSCATTRVQLVVDMEIENFDSHLENILKHALAGLLKISPRDVSILSKEEGSVKLILGMPSAAARDLVEMFETGREEVSKSLALFEIESIRDFADTTPSLDRAPDRGVTGRAALNFPVVVPGNSWQQATDAGATALAYQRVILSKLPWIDRMIEQIGRRLGLSREGIQELASLVKLKLLEDDYAILREFRGKSSIETYLTVVITNIGRDFRNTAWLSARTPSHSREAEEELADRPAEAIEPDQQMRQSKARKRLEQGLKQALAKLSAEDALLVKLSTEMKMSEISRVLHLDQKSLYRRRENILKKLRHALESDGFRLEEISDFLYGLQPKSESDT